MEGINLEINKIYFYCDPKTMLNYISNKNSNFGVYVAHRIKKKWENSSICQWQYIPSNMKVGENAARSISFNQFGSNSRRSTGPNFLLNAALGDFSEKIVSTHTYVKP